MRIVDALLAPHWPHVEAALTPQRSPSDKPDFANFVSWNNRVSPGFPQGSTLVYYAFAAGLQLARLTDGEWVTKPWARVVVEAATLDAELELFGTPERLGAQGVRPLRPDEAWIYPSADAIQQEVIAATASGTPLSPRVRDWYCFWIGVNRVAQELRPHHPVFFAWLDEA